MTKGARVLIVEDEAALMRGLTDTFRAHGFDVIAEPESFLVTKKDRLEPGETARAREWGASLAERIVPAR